MNVKKSPQETPPTESTKVLTTRESVLFQNFSDQASPGYGNATKSAELAGYKGLPGSNQLAVQGSRTLKKARELGLLRPLLVEQGCTLERAAERLAACLDAKRTREFMTKDGTVIKGEPQDDYHQQRLAAKLVFELHGALDGASSPERPLIERSSPLHATNPDANIVPGNGQGTDLRKDFAGRAKAEGCAEPNKEPAIVDPTDRMLIREAAEIDRQIGKLSGERTENPNQDERSKG